MASIKFVVNPAAARGKCARVAKDLEQLCRDRKLDFDFEYTQKEKDAIGIAQKAADSFDVVVAVGGDGTIHETVNGLMEGKAKFGVIPVGSGNDFVRAMKIPSGLTQALDTVVAGHSKRIDIGKADHTYFPNGMGIGFDSWVVETSKSVRKLRGSTIYFYSVLRTIYSYQAPVMRLRYGDVDREEKIFMVTIGNGISLGGGFKLTPHAIMDDGVFDLNIVTDLTKAQVYKNLVSVYSGSHTKMPQVTTGRTSEITIDSEQGFAVHLDGELLSLNMKSLNVTLIPKALDVIIPASANG